MPLASIPIVGILEVVKDLYLGFCPRGVNQLIHPLALQAVKEQLRHIVI